MRLALLALDRRGRRRGPARRDVGRPRGGVTPHIHPAMEERFTVTRRPLPVPQRPAVDRGRPGRDGRRAARNAPRVPQSRLGADARPLRGAAALVAAGVPRGRRRALARRQADEDRAAEAERAARGRGAASTATATWSILLFPAPPRPIQRIVFGPLARLAERRGLRAGGVRKARLVDLRRRQAPAAGEVDGLARVAGECRVGDARVPRPRARRARCGPRRPGTRTCRRRRARPARRPRTCRRGGAAARRRALPRRGAERPAVHAAPGRRAARPAPLLDRGLEGHGTRRRRCVAAESASRRRRRSVAQVRDHVGALAAPDHAQAARLALERLVAAQRGDPVMQAPLLGRQPRDLRPALCRRSRASTRSRAADARRAARRADAAARRASLPTRSQRIAPARTGRPPTARGRVRTGAGRAGAVRAVAVRPDAAGAARAEAARTCRDRAVRALLAVAIGARFNAARRTPPLRARAWRAARLRADG